MPVVGSTYSKQPHLHRHRPTIGIIIKRGSITTEAQSHHDRRRVSIDYRRGNGNRVYHIQHSRAWF